MAKDAYEVLYNNICPTPASSRPFPSSPDRTRSGSGNGRRHGASAAAPPPPPRLPVGNAQVGEDTQAHPPSRLQIGKVDRAACTARPQLGVTAEVLSASHGRGQVLELRSSCAVSLEYMHGLCTNVLSQENRGINRRKRGLSF